MTAVHDICFCFFFQILFMVFIMEIRIFWVKCITLISTLYSSHLQLLLIFPIK